MPTINTDKARGFYYSDRITELWNEVALDDQDAKEAMPIGKIE